MKDVILQDVLDYILKCNNNDKLVEINEALKDKLKTNSSYLKYNLKPDDIVKVTGSNKVARGRIYKVNRTRAIVKVTVDEVPMHWNVPFTMITKLEVPND